MAGLLAATTAGVTPDGGDPYRPGFVVVPRQWRRIKIKGLKRTRTGWTLHRDDCFQIVRDGMSTAMPAPKETYPDTVSCLYCRPDDPHRFIYQEQPDGSTYATCTACELTAHQRVRKVAMTRMHRLHTAQCAAEAMAAALAAGPVERVIAERCDGRGWTLHRPQCYYIARGRSEIVLPVVTDDDIPDKARTKGCTLCKPAGVPRRERKSPPRREPATPAPPLVLDPDEHEIARADTPDGACRMVCSCGGDTGVRPNNQAARQALRRFHVTQAKRAARDMLPANS